MNSAFLAPMEALWHSPAFPMWATLVAAAFFGIVLLITLLRADRSVANGALAIIALLAIGIAVAAIVRGTVGNGALVRSDAPQTLIGQGALACLDGLAGDRVEAACEKALFASADATAAAVSYTAAQLSRLPAAASSELTMLRRVLERDRYGLAAQVLTTREGCTPDNCETFRYLTNTSQIVTNMNERAFETLISRHEEDWEAPGQQQQASAPGPSKGADIDYPSASSIPPVSIMTAEPPRAAAEQRASEPATAPAASSPPPRGAAPVVTPHMALPPNSVPFPASNAQAASSPSAPAAKRAPSPPAQAKRAAAPPPSAAAPVQLVPPQ